ncbi:uncharacterized protein LOC118413318 isoform X1 [Branchiostoma floridae]|uniref:RING-type E3 ubiquitin transferase n=1 Tax=Branchiostoma floridae TaxID=7739 RepID=A0A9J7KXW5_BRAFL|nr:uncharacterized protein LOC118413318 isoform X1 [Branchiostoma floridae]XP_035672519.1 uncharacterized protein LOC118413318 isoform X1 [Branchiostoma floridae]
MDMEDKSLFVGRQKGGDSHDCTPIYTVVTAVLSPDMVDKLPTRRREFLQKLQTDTGVSINLHKGGGTYEVEGSLAQLQQVHDILSELVGNQGSPRARLKKTTIPNGLPSEEVHDASGTKPIVDKEVSDKPVTNGTPKSKVSPSGKPRGEIVEKRKSRNSEDDDGFEIIGEAEQEEAASHHHQPAVRPKVRHQRPMAAQFDNHDSVEKASGANTKSVRERHEEEGSDLSSDDEDVMALDQDTFNYLYHAYQDKLQDIRRQYRVKFRSKSNETDMLKFKVIPKDPSTTLDQLTTAKDSFIALYQSVFPNLVQEVMELAYDPALAQQVKTAIDKTRKDHPDVYVQVENNNHRFAFIGEQVQVIEAKSQFRQLSGVMSGLVRQVGRHHTLGGHIIVPTNLEDEIREDLTRNLGSSVPEGYPYAEEIELRERKTSGASEPVGSRGVRFKQQSDRYVFRTKEGITVSMYQGDLTQENVTAIVNAANGYLAHAAGIAAAIQEQAGPSLEEECRKYISKHGPLYETQVMHTSAGNLPCHYVIHAVGPKWRDYSNKTECASALRVTFLNCLDYANEKLHATTVALPAISTGIFGVPNDVCAKAVYDAVRDFSKSQSQLGSLGEVRLVNAELDMVHVLRQMFEVSMSQEEEEEEGCQSPSSGSAFIRISKTTEEVLAATSPRAARRREEAGEVEEEDTEVAQITEMAPEEGEEEPEVEPLEDIHIVAGKPKLLHSISDPHGASGERRRKQDKSDVSFTSITPDRPTRDPNPTLDQESAPPSSDDQTAAAEVPGTDEDDPDDKRPVQFTTKPPPEEGVMSEKEKVIKDLLDNFDKLTDTERGLLDQLLTETDPRSGQSHGVHKPRVRSRSLDRSPKQPPGSVEREASRTRSPLRSQKARSTKPKDNCLLCNTTEQLRTVPFCKVGHKYCLQCKVKYYSRLRTCPHKDCHEPVTPDFRSASKSASNDTENKQFTSATQASADPSKGQSAARIHFPSDVDNDPSSQEPTYGTLYPSHESSYPSEQPTNTQSTAGSRSSLKNTSNVDGRRRSSDSTLNRGVEPESQSRSGYVPETRVHHGSSHTADPSSFSPRRRVSDSGASSTYPEPTSSQRIRTTYSLGEKASQQHSQSKRKQRGLIVKSLAEDIDDVGLDSGHPRQGWDSDTHKGRDSENCSICRSTFMNPKTLPSCGHVFCTPCIDRAMQIKPVCPICGEVYGQTWGSQPEGTMEWKVDPHLPLPGYERQGTIVVMYDFPDGIQTSDHPNPGRRYYGCHRRAYLPNTAEGQEVCRLLHKAFQAKLLFTVGQSVTTGMDNCVIWNDVHHKTNTHGGPTNHGYPDPDYLRRVKEELAVKGITTL